MDILKSHNNPANRQSQMQVENTDKTVNNSTIYPLQNISKIQEIDNFSYQPNHLIWSRCVYYSKTKFAAGTEKGEIILVDVQNHECNQIDLKDAPKSQVKDIAFLQKNSIIVVCFVGTYLHAWDLKNGNEQPTVLPYKSLTLNYIVIQDRYLAFPIEAVENKIIIIDSKKRFKIVHEINLPLIYELDRQNYVRFINCFDPCSNMLTFIDEKYLFVYDFFTKRFVNRISLKKYGLPFKVKTYRQEHYYYVLILFNSNRLSVFDVIKGEQLFKKNINEGYGSSIQCCEFLNSSNIIIGMSSDKAFIINFITNDTQIITNKEGFVGSFTYKNRLYTTADKQNKIFAYQLD